MPFYDYECQECNTTIEVKASISEKAAGLAVACPSCGSVKTEQVFRTLAFTGAGASSGSPFAAGDMPGKGAACGPGCGCFPQN